MCLETCSVTPLSEKRVEFFLFTTLIVEQIVSSGWLELYKNWNEICLYTIVMQELRPVGRGREVWWKAQKRGCAVGVRGIEWRSGCVLVWSGM